MFEWIKLTCGQEAESATSWVEVVGRSRVEKGFLGGARRLRWASGKRHKERRWAACFSASLGSRIPPQLVNLFEFFRGTEISLSSFVVLKESVSEEQNFLSRTEQSWSCRFRQLWIKRQQQFKKANRSVWQACEKFGGGSVNVIVVWETVHQMLNTGWLHDLWIPLYGCYPYVP